MRHAFLFLIDDYYRRLSLNQRVQRFPPVASVLINYAFVMMMTISLHTYRFTGFAEYRSPMPPRNFKQKSDLI